MYETQWTEFRGKGCSWTGFTSEDFNVNWNKKSIYCIWLNWDLLLVALLYGYNWIIII